MNNRNTDKKQTVLILHGWGLSGSTFAPLVKELETAGYRAYAPDLPGFGDTPIPDRPLTLTDYVEFVRSYVKRLGIRQFILIGHSFGGRVSLLYQQMYPGHVTVMVLTGTPGFTPVPRKKLLLFVALAKIGNIIFSLPPLTLFKDWVRRWYYYVVGAREYFRAEGAMRETFKHIVAQDLVGPMEAVSVPCLLLWGEFDVIVPVAIAERMAQVIPNARLQVIPDGNHGVVYKEAPQFVSYMKKFLASL